MPAYINQILAQQIVEAVKDICTYDINFINTKGIIFASTNPKRIGDFHEIGRKVIITGETIEVDGEDSFLGTKQGVNIPLKYKGEINAVIGLSGPPAEVRKYAYLAQRISLLILREHELDTLEHIQKTQMNQMIRSIIKHEQINPEYMMDFFSSYKTTLDTEYRTILIKLDTQCNPANLALIEHAIYQVFDSAGSEFYTFHYPNEYILFLESAKFEQARPLFEQLGKKQAPFLKIGVGTSRPLPRQHRSYHAAKIAVDSLFPGESFAFIDNLNLELLLGDAKDIIKEFYLKQTVAPLSDKDQELLKIYYSNNMSLKETCDRLYLHKNTLQYQLDRIHKKTGYNPREFKDAVVLYIGLKMLS